MNIRTNERIHQILTPLVPWTMQRTTAPFLFGGFWVLLVCGTQEQTKSCGAWSVDLSRKCVEVESGVLKGEGTAPPFSFMLALLWTCGLQCKRPPWKSLAEYSGVTNQGEPGSLIIVELPEQLLVISEDLNMREIKFCAVQKQNSVLLLWGFYHLKPKQILKKVFTKSFLLDWA